MECRECFAVSSDTESAIFGALTQQSRTSVLDMNIVYWKTPPVFMLACLYPCESCAQVSTTSHLRLAAVSKSIFMLGLLFPP